MYNFAIFSASPEQNINVNNFWDSEAKNWADYSLLCKHGSRSLCLWLPMLLLFMTAHPASIAARREVE